MSTRLSMFSTGLALAVFFLARPMPASAQMYTESATNRTFYDFICYNHNAQGECTNYSYITPRDSFRGNYWDSDFQRGDYGRDYWRGDWQYRRPYDRYYPRRHTDVRFRDDWYSDYYTRNRYWDDRYDERNRYRYDDRYRYDRGCRSTRCR